MADSIYLKCLRACLEVTPESVSSEVSPSHKYTHSRDSSLLPQCLAALWLQFLTRSISSFSRYLLESLLSHAVSYMLTLGYQDGDLFSFTIFSLLTVIRTDLLPVLTDPPRQGQTCSSCPHIISSSWDKNKICVPTFKFWSGCFSQPLSPTHQSSVEEILAQKALWCVLWLTHVGAIFLC